MLCLNEEWIDLWYAFFDEEANIGLPSCDGVHGHQLSLPSGRADLGPAGMGPAILTVLWTKLNVASRVPMSHRVHRVERSGRASDSLLESFSCLLV